MVMDDFGFNIGPKYMFKGNEYVSVGDGWRSEVSLTKHVSEWIAHKGIRLLMAIYAGLMRTAKFVNLKERIAECDHYDILITGTFYSDNWIRSHLQPLAASRSCSRVRMVSETPVPFIDKVEAIYPTPWMIRMVGGDLARLVTFVWVGLRTRPHIVGGFHLLLNGLVAVLLARVINARSLYICGGGPREVVGGGYSTENRLFRKLRTPDAVVERRLLQAVAAFDLVITMGSGATNFFQQRGVKTKFHIVPGGFEGDRFYLSEKPRDIDLILVGRLSSVKRADLFLQVVNLVRDVLPDVSATVVGGGPLRSSLEQFAKRLGIEHNVKFVGQQHQIEEWLRHSKIFVLTSDSEGLSLAMIEAMLCGLPAVVTDVGDLGDLVEDGINGFLVPDRTPEAFALRLIDLLKDSERLLQFGRAARQSAERFEISNVSHLWDKILLARADEGSQE